MSRIREEEFPPSDAWPEPKSAFTDFYPYLPKIKTCEPSLLPLDEVEEFHDPFSELNLFLSREISQYIKRKGKEEKWSVLLERDLLNQIFPLFRHRYPHLRLSASALKKIWDKTIFCLSQLNQSMWTEEGKLDPFSMIKENLKQVSKLEETTYLHPYGYAHQMALKIAECISLIDGYALNLEELTKTIWGLFKHLVPYEQLRTAKTSFEDHDKLDQCIVKVIVDILKKTPDLSHDDLFIAVKKSFLKTVEFSHFELDKLSPLIYLLLGHSFTPSFQIDSQVASFIETQVQKLVSLYPHFGLRECREVVEKTLKLIQLTKELPEVWDDHSTYLYPYLQAQSFLFKNSENHFLKETFYYAKSLALGKETTNEWLEIYIWRAVYKHRNALNLPLELVHFIQEEIDCALITNPEEPFQTLFQTILRVVKRSQEAAGSIISPFTAANFDKRILFWTMQGEMILRWLRFNPDLPLLKFIHEKGKERPYFKHHSFLEEVVDSYLKLYPHLTAKKEKVKNQAFIFYKHLWYTSFAHYSESSLDRYLKWHYCESLEFYPFFSLSEIQANIQEQLRVQLPFIPIDEQKLSLTFSREEVNSYYY